jgi:hypothetical protein
MLSHEDHRRLAAIEQQLLIEDPDFVRRLRRPSFARRSRWRRAAITIIGVLCALATMVGVLSGSGPLTLISGLLTTAAWWMLHRTRRIRR